MLTDWIWLSTRKGIGSRSVLRALSYFTTAEEAFRAPEQEYRLAGFTDAEAAAFSDKSLDGPGRILEECAQKGIHILTYQDAAYSARLRNLPDAPPFYITQDGFRPL